MKTFFFSALTFMIFICGCQQPVPVDLAQGTWIDLSHPYDSQTPYWPTANGFHLDTVFEGMTEGGYYYSAYEFKSAEHGGTHMDAPIHFAEGKNTVDEIGLDQLIGPAVVIDVQDSVRDYIDYQVQVSDFEQWEATHGTIPDGAIVLLRTGIAEFWPNKESYMGTSVTGPAGVALLHFPGLHPDAAQWLVDNRKISAIGLDTPSIDYGRSSSFMSHRILMEENIPAFENIASLVDMPEKGAWVIALPMKIKSGSGAPLRIAAFIPD